MYMYAMNIQNDIIGLVQHENCKSKQMTDFIAWPSRCHDTMCHGEQTTGSADWVCVARLSFCFEET
jgi:hypothetical protein